MAVPRYSIRVMYVVREGYSNQVMDHLVKQAKTVCTKPIPITAGVKNRNFERPKTLNFITRLKLSWWVEYVGIFKRK